MLTVPTEEKARLLSLLDDAYEKHRALLQEIDSTALVYADGPWHVRDVAAHVMVWNHEAAASLEAFAKGKAYSIVDYPGIHAYNRAAVEDKRRYDTGHIYQEWQKSHTRLRAAIDAIAPEAVHADMMHPWGAEGSAAELVEDMVSHEETHFTDICRAVDRPYPE